MDEIIWHEIKRNFKWKTILLFFLGIVLSSIYLYQALIVHASHKILFWEGFVVLAFALFIISGLTLLIFVKEFLSLYIYYKRQVDEMEAESQTPLT